MTAIRNWWGAMNPALKTALVAMGASTLIVGAVLFGAMLFDLTDGEVKDWWKLRWVAAITWVGISVTVGMAFWAIGPRGLTAEQWEVLRKLKEGKL